MDPDGILLGEFVGDADGRIARRIASLLLDRVANLFPLLRALRDGDEVLLEVRLHLGVRDLRLLEVEARELHGMGGLIVVGRRPGGIEAVVAHVERSAVDADEASLVARTDEDRRWALRRRRAV